MYRPIIPSWMRSSESPPARKYELALSRTNLRVPPHERVERRLAAVAGLQHELQLELTLKLSVPASARPQCERAMAAVSPANWRFFRGLQFQAGEKSQPEVEEEASTLPRSLQPFCEDCIMIRTCPPHPPGRCGSPHYAVACVCDHHGMTTVLIVDDHPSFRCVGTGRAGGGRVRDRRRGSRRDDGAQDAAEAAPRRRAARRPAPRHERLRRAREVATSTTPRSSSSRAATPATTTASSRPPAHAASSPRRNCPGPP